MLKVVVNLFHFFILLYDDLFLYHFDLDQILISRLHWICPHNLFWGSLGKMIHHARQVSTASKLRMHRSEVQSMLWYINGVAIILVYKSIQKMRRGALITDVILQHDCVGANKRRRQMVTGAMISQVK